MSWFKSKPGVDLVTDAEGLANVVRVLHEHCGLVSHSQGVTVRVFAQSRGTLLVFLTHEQTQVLRSVIPNYSIHDYFGASDE